MKMFKSRYLIVLALLAFISTVVTPAFAQQTMVQPPSQIQYALDDLSVRSGQTVALSSLTSYQWQGRQFSDASLGCPQPGEMYAQVVTSGYQFTITYAGKTYDYRVSDDGTYVVMCGSENAQTPATTVPGESPCGPTYTVAIGDWLYSIARECDTTVQALLDANPEIENRAIIYPGQVLQIPQSGDIDPTPVPGEQSVSISPQSGPPGTQVEVTASGFPPNMQVNIGLGPYESEYQVIETTTTDANGNVVADGRIPSDVRVGDEWVFLVELNNEETISQIFHVTDADGGNLFERTNIYLVALEDAGSTGQEIGCGDSLIPVEIAIEPTVAPLTAALENLFDINSEFYGQSGLYNPFYNSNLTVDGIDIVNREAQINLSGDLSVGGTCDAPRIEEALRQTALQYSTIDTVSVNINGEPIETILSGQ